MGERELDLRDGHRLFYRIWMCENPKATVHINHGMAEHSRRYTDFARYLNSLGFIVYAQDHRGHGYTADEDERGYFADENGADMVIADSFELDEAIMKNHPDLPHFIFGHSMGSFITRCAISRYPVYDGAVICGTGYSQGLLGLLGRAIANHHVKKWGARMKDDGLDKLAFSSYDKPFKGEGKFAWLTRDASERKKYIDDPLCGFVCSSSFYRDLIDLITMANDKARSQRIPRNLPILIVSGDKDPVGSFGKGVLKVENFYRMLGINNLKVRLYEGARHEIINETNRKEVYEDIGAFYLGILEKINA